MNDAPAIAALNRLYHLTLRSFPAYSAEVRLVVFRGPEELRDLLKQIAQEQQALAARIEAAIRDAKGSPDPGPFPIEFTSWNDVDLATIVRRSIELQEQLISEATRLADLDPRPPVFHYAKQVLNQAVEHTARLQQTLAPA